MAQPRLEFKLRCELIGHQEDVSRAAIVVSFLVVRAWRASSDSASHTQKKHN
jgi:hypothetical protein